MSNFKYGLNAGSGQRRFHNEGDWCWTNLDINPRWEPDIVGDWNDLQSVQMYDVIVAHQTIEHVGCGEADPFFRGAYRALKLGGSLIITIPDLRALAQRWLTGQITDYIYIVNLMGAYMDNDADRHKWHYTRESLTTSLMNCAEWKTIKTFDYRAIPGADIARDFWILGMEAVK